MARYLKIAERAEGFLANIEVRLPREWNPEKKRIDLQSRRSASGKKVPFGLRGFCPLFWILLLLFGGYGDVWAQSMARVGVLPFRIYAQDRAKVEEWSKKIPPAMAAELTRDDRMVLIPEERVIAALEKAGKPEIDEDVAREIGRSIEADLMILGSVTQINGAISLDARIVDVYQPGVLAAAFAVGRTGEDFPAMASRLSREIRIRAMKEEEVTQIGIEGNRAIEESAIRSVIKIKEGDILASLRLREDVRAIFQLGYFKDVRAEKRDWGRGKAIFFIVEEKPVVRQIKFSGNKKIKADDLRESMDLKPGATLNLDAIKENRNKILKKYREEAYYAAEVEYVLETPRPEDVVVHYKITEHEKVKIEKITFSGNLHFSDAVLKNVLPEIEERNWLSWLRKRAIYKEDILERDLDALLVFYFQKGFLEAKVGKPQVTIEKQGIKILIPIEEGRQYKVGKVEILGDLIAPKEELYKLVSLYVGEILNRDHIRDSVMRLTDRYADHGYAFADVNPQTIIHREKDLVDITFEIQQGNKVYFDRINITGNVKTRDKVIRRELAIVEGELYSLDGIKKSRQRLAARGYFKLSNLNPKKGSAEDRMDVDIQVEEAPTGAFSIGGGYSTMDKLMAIIQVSQNNIFGRGQRVGVSAAVGSISQYYNIFFHDPQFLDTNVSFNYELYKIRRDYTTYKIDRNGTAFRFGYPLFEQVRLWTGYRYERINIMDIVPNASLIIQSQAGWTTTSAVNLMLRRDARNNYIDPTSGTDTSIWVDYAGGPLGGTNYFTRYGAEAKIFTTPYDPITFMWRGRIGYIQARDGHIIPLQELYRLGGVYSLRGFSAWSVGPKAPNGEVIGGDKELLFNFETIFPISKEIKLKGVLFFDAGNAWAPGVPYNLGDLRTSVGFGLRWISPMGPIQLMWGYNTSPQPGEKHSGWDFAMGTLF
jgi:outer membrane protein insertion porin family